MPYLESQVQGLTEIYFKGFSFMICMSKIHQVLHSLGILAAALLSLGKSKRSLCSSPLRARASAVYGQCNSLKFPVREEVSAQRGQN